jgi:predicted O-methyltransferase YrrM
MRRCATTREAEMTPAEHELLRQTLRQQGPLGKHLEIGTAAGGTLCAMLESFPDGQRPQFVVVDPMTYFPQQRSVVVENLKDHGLDPKQVDFRITTSSVAFERASLQHESFSFMLIDGCHKIRSVTTDLKWTRLLESGGIVCFHDMTPQHRGVWLAVRRFLNRHPEYERVAQADSLLVVRKRQAASQTEVSPLCEWYAAAWYLPLQFERKWQRWRKAA